MKTNFSEWVRNVSYDLKRQASLKMLYYSRKLQPGYRERTILFYPDKPQIFHILYGICHTLGCRMTDNPGEKADLVMAFEDITVRGEDKVLEGLIKKTHVVNGKCRDISKEHVEEVFGRVFGYGSRVDPEKHKGECVRKSNNNALHDGKIIKCPRKAEKGYFYQKLIDNVEDGWALDLRLPIFRETIPFVVRRRKTPDSRFDHTLGVDTVSVEKILSPEEVTKVLKFCREIGLEYGELDTLRDGKSGRLYIVDANNTPAGPQYPLNMSKTEYCVYLGRLSRVFENVFLGGHEQ